jgi:hypothetical protein
MALIPPPPNNNLSEDSQTDSIWKGWFERIRYLINNNVISTAWTSLTGTITSAQLAAAVSDETGTGAAVFANTPTLVTPVIGAATGTSLGLTGAITIGDVAALIKTSAAMNNGAAAAAGTLLNAPVAGNPTKWVPFDDNGTIRYFPAW